MLAWVNVSANYAQIPHAHSSNPPAPLSRQRTKKTKETDKQTVTEKKKKKYKRQEAFFPYSSWAETTAAFNQLVFPASSAWAASVVQASDQRWERSSPPSCCRPWTTGQSMVSRFHSAVAFTVIAPSLIKIQPVSSRAHTRVFACCFCVRVQWMHPRTSLKGMWIPGLCWVPAAQLGFLPVGGGVVGVCVCLCICVLGWDARRIKWLGASGSGTHTHTQAEKELVLWRGKQEQTVRSHQPHHTLYYADLGVYCKLIRNPGVTGGHST